MKNILLVILVLFTTQALAKGTKLTVKIDGMSCPSCAASVEGQFKKFDEVSNIDINLSKGIATVTLKENKVLAENKVKKAVEKAGFKAISVKFFN